MTPDDLFRKVCAIVDETEVSGSRDAHSRTVLQLGLTLAAAGLRALPEKNRERLLPRVREGIEGIMAAWAEHARQHPHKRWVQ